MFVIFVTLLFWGAAALCEYWNGTGDGTGNLMGVFGKVNPLHGTIFERYW